MEADVMAAAHNPLYARRMIAIGALYYGQHKHDDALRSLNRAVEIAKENGDDAAEGAAYVQIATMFELEKNLKESATYTKKAMQLAIESHNLPLEAYCTSMLAYAYQKFHNNAEALTYFAQAISIYERVRYYRQSAYLLSDMAQACVKIRDYNRALSNLKNELEIARRYKDRAAIADVYNYSAIIYNETHNYADAIKYQQEAEKYFQPGDITSFAAADIFIAKMYTKMHNYENSLEYAKKALNVSSEIDNTIYEAGALGFMADAYYKMKRYGQAMDHVQKSIGS